MTITGISNITELKDQYVVRNDTDLTEMLFTGLKIETATKSYYITAPYIVEIKGVYYKFIDLYGQVIEFNLASTTYTESQLKDKIIAGQSKSQSKQCIVLDANHILTRTTSVQSLLGDSVSVASGITYTFECAFDLIGLSATSGSFQFSFLGTATITDYRYTAVTSKASTGTPSTPKIITVKAASGAANLTENNTETAGQAIIKGTIKINAGGTLIPAIALTQLTDASVAAGSFFCIDNIN